MNTRDVVLGSIALLLALAFGAYALTREPAPVPAPASLEAQGEFRFELADTEEARERGLSGRAEVPSDYGMLFVFEDADRYGFWMKDMLVPIDIIWLADDGSIIGIEREVSPATYPDVFYPPKSVRYVLETRAGEAARKGWGIGTPIVLPLQ